MPFFAYTVISTFIFSGIIEGVYKLKTNGSILRYLKSIH